MELLKVKVAKYWWMAAVVLWPLFGEIKLLRWLLAFLALWIIYVKAAKLRILLLPILFWMVIVLNQVCGWTGRLNCDWERMNLGNPKYSLMIEGYKYDDVVTPYQVRTRLYSGRMEINLWFDSALKLMSLGNLLTVLGWAGGIGVAFGVTQIKWRKDWYYLAWFLTVIGAGAMLEMVDSKKAMLAAVPVLVWLFYLGGKKMASINMSWLLVAAIVVDLIMR
jgi:hypothetical protein